MTHSVVGRGEIRPCPRRRDFIPPYVLLGFVIALVLILVIAPVMADPSGGATTDHEPHPFDETRDAMADVDAALAAASARGTRALLVLGGNWCHDSRGLAEKFEAPDLAALIAERYELVWIDVGRRNRNMNVPKRFGVHDLLGTPSILILSGEGELLNADSVHDWRNADSRTLEETYEYFAGYADGFAR